MSKTPNIRFKGFTTPWKQRKLGEIVDVCSGRDYKHLDDGDIPVYGTGGYMLSVSEALSESDDAIGIGRKGTIDNPFILRAPFWTVDTLFYCIPKKDYDLDFVFSIFQNINWKAMDESTGVPSLSKTTINNADVMAPAKAQQDKIGGYFSQIDNLITLRQRKCDEMSELKKFMLQKMFPKNDEQFPEIRFSGFNAPWERRKLGEVFIQTSKIVNPKEDNVELWSLTVEDGLTKKTERYTRDFLVKKDDNFKEVRPGDIVYNPMNMTLGAVGYNGMNQSVAVSGYYTTMITKEGYDAYYINTWLKSPQAILLYKTYATGSLIEKQRVQFPTLSIIPAAFPRYEEQKKIGDYFRSLDTLITLQQRKCDELKDFKKYMLQNMFPKKG